MGWIQIKMDHPLGALSPFRANGAHPSLVTVDFQLVVQKSRRESAHARTWAGILNRKFCACVNSRRNIWTTNWKSTVQGFSGPLSQKSDENRRMRAFWREF